MVYRITCCKDCVPPKRHPGCHGSCPEYIAERAELDKQKEEDWKNSTVKRYEDSGLYIARTKRAKRQIKADRYRIGSDSNKN